MNADARAFTPESIILDGGLGKMARLYDAWFKKTLPNVPVEKADLLSVQGNARWLRRQSKAALYRHYGDRNSQNLVMLSLPFSAFSSCLDLNPRSRFNTLLGVSPQGWSNSAAVSLASLMTKPLETLNPFSGAVMAIHNLHGIVPSVENETVVIGVSKEKQNHHLFGRLHHFWVEFLRAVGYRKIVTLGPDQHDSAMADIQFLCHLFFLMLGYLLKEHFGSFRAVQNAAIENPLLDDIVEMVRRITSGSHHVYWAIAKENHFNRGLLAECEHAISGMSALTLGSAVSVISFAVHQATIQQRRESGHGLATPVSRVRNGIIHASLSNPQCIAHYPLRGSANQSLTSYKEALSNEGAFKAFFASLSDFYESAKPNRSIEVINKYTR